MIVELLTDILLSGRVYKLGDIVDVSPTLASDLINRQRAKAVEDQKKGGRKVAIVGTAPTKSQAPYDDKDWEIWGLNTKFEQVKRADRWFELHKKERVKGSYLEFLSSLDDKAYIADPEIGLKDAVLYPKDTIVKEFGDFFTNTVSWMLALAIFEGVSEIGLYGIDMAVGSEYEYQKPSVLYFIGIAEGRGIKITQAKGNLIFEGTDKGRSKRINEKFNACYYLGRAVGSGLKIGDLFYKKFLYWKY